MNQWTEKKDGWHYSQDNLQRWKKIGDRVTVESVNDEPSLTQQQFKEDCDVNTIMDKYMKTGLMPNSVAPMMEGDFSELPNYQEALHTIMQAESMFMEIPATTRLRFENNPQKLMDYLKDPANNEESIKLGLRNPKPNPPQPDLNTELLREIVTNTKKKKTDPE